jgi:hypothetical protein
VKKILRYGDSNTWGWDPLEDADNIHLEANEHREPCESTAACVGEPLG